MAEQECIFCRIGRGEVPAEFLYRDDSVFAIRDINPKAPVHLLVIPFSHVGILTADPQPKPETLGKLVAVAAQLAREHGVDTDGYRLIINQGPDAGQTFPHLHLHLLAGHRLSDLG